MNGCMKMNVDAVVGRHGDMGSCAVVYRNHSGVYGGAYLLIMHDMIQPEILEAIVVREALCLAHDLNHIHIATYCLIVVNNLENSHLGRSNPIIQDIKEMMTEFDEVHIMHEKREHKWEARDLAKFSVTLDSGRHLWLLNPPDFMYLPLSFSVE